jgi:hypothetical protein
MTNNIFVFVVLLELFVIALLAARASQATPGRRNSTRRLNQDIHESNTDLLADKSFDHGNSPASGVPLFGDIDAEGNACGYRHFE